MRAAGPAAAGAGPSAPVARRPPDRGSRRRRRAWARLRADRLAVLGLAITAALLTVAAFGPLLLPFDPAAGDITARHQGVSAAHPLGTDFLGRDQLVRIVHGARTSLFASLGAMAAVVLIATAVGVAAGFFGGAVDAVLMRLVEVLMAFPTLVLALAITGLLGPGLRNALIAIVAVWWTDLSRIIRAEVIAVRSRDYVEAAVATGGSPWWIATRHVLPNIASTLTVVATLDAGSILLGLASLSFLGLGEQPPAPEWGRMLFDAKPYLDRQPLEMLVPGVAIAVAVLGLNLLGDGLRDALDPRQRRH